MSDPIHETRSRGGQPGGLLLLAVAGRAWAADADRDGLDDPTEILLGTDPNLPDTDGDRFSDGGESLVLATDPLIADPFCEWPNHEVRLNGVAGDMWPADIDHDGDLDILEVHNTAGTFAYENDGTGAFTQHWIDSAHTNQQARFVRNIDFDGDGDEDVLSAFGDGVALYENLGGWTFDFRDLFLYQEYKPWTPSVVDLDLDGDLDIVVSTSEFLYTPNLLWLIRNVGGTFAPPVVIAEYGVPNLSWAADIDNDGWSDLVVQAEELVWYRNGGPGQPFSPPRLIGRDIGPGHHLENALHVADLDGDGWKDLVMVNWMGNLWVVWNLGQPGGWSEAQEVVTKQGISNSVKLWPADLDRDVTSTSPSSGTGPPTMSDGSRTWATGPSGPSTRSPPIPSAHTSSPVATSTPTATTTCWP